MTDEEYMRRAISLAKKGEGYTAPNPVVGAVIVKDGKIIGEGYHVKCGADHAERSALNSCTEDPRGAVIYVTMTPCCHFGRTPPCTDAIVSSGIRRVVIGSRDPNPKVGERSIQILSEAGVEITRDLLRAECDPLNEVFFRFITTGMPYIAMKYAMTADGKTATQKGLSKWITGEDAREHAHGLRHRYSGIMVGIGTVLADDPLLSCRIPGGINPVRIVCDSRLRISANSQLCRTAHEIPLIVLTGERAAEDRRRVLRIEELGATVIAVPEEEVSGQLDLRQAALLLGKEGIDSVLLEGGGVLNNSALQAGLVGRLYVYVAPKLFGGAAAKAPVAGQGIEFPDEAVPLSAPQLRMFENGDLLLEYEVLQRKS